MTNETTATTHDTATKRPKQNQKTKRSDKEWDIKSNGEC